MSPGRSGSAARRAGRRIALRGPHPSRTSRPTSCARLTRQRRRAGRLAAVGTCTRSAPARCMPASARAASRSASACDADTDSLNAVRAGPASPSGPHRALLALGYTDHETAGDAVTWNAEYGYALSAAARVLYGLAGTRLPRAPTRPTATASAATPTWSPSARRTCEVGVRHRARRRGTSLSFAAFRNDIDDLIEFVDPVVRPVRRAINRNVAEARIEGIEAAWEYDAAPVAGCASRRSTRTRATAPTDERAAAPRPGQPHRVRAARVRPGSTLGLDVLAAGERKDFGFPRPVTLDGYVLANLTARWQVTPVAVADRSRREPARRAVRAGPHLQHAGPRPVRVAALRPGAGAPPMVAARRPRDAVPRACILGSGTSASRSGHGPPTEQDLHAHRRRRQHRPRRRHAGAEGAPARRGLRHGGRGQQRGRRGARGAGPARRRASSASPGSSTTCSTSAANSACPGHRCIAASDVDRLEQALDALQRRSAAAQGLHPAGRRPGGRGLPPRAHGRAARRAARVGARPRRAGRARGTRSTSTACPTCCS
ncbi:MAG: TonB-dependent receptor [Chromatiales bacterium]|nr:TonB-dependent receptor [Chromatiales bacterium]